MAMRAYTVSWLHVEALDRIGLEFNKNQEREVIKDWKHYHDLINDTSIPIEQWASKRAGLLVEPIHKMEPFLITISSYSPRAHEETEIQEIALRKGLIEVLEGKRTVLMSITDRQQGNPH